MRFTTGTIRVEADRHHITLPRVGRLKTHESTRKLARRLEAGTARIMSVTVRYESGRAGSRVLPSPARQVAVKRLPRTTTVDKTGTARW